MGYKLKNRFLRLALIPALFAGSLPLHAENLTPNLKFNGFATASVSVLNEEQSGAYIKDYFGYPGITQKTPNAGLESLAGLQFDYKVNDQVNVVAQLVAQGRNNYDVNAEWAYIGYQINDQFRVRGGHFGLPIFMYSDTIHVGQSYPWARLPVEVYGDVPVTTFDGMDLLYRQPVGDWNLNAQLLLGGSSTAVFRTDNSSGLNLSLSNENLTLRMGYIASHVTVNKLATMPACPACVINKASSSFANIGALYDDGHWFIASEFAGLRADSWTRSWNAGYLSIGHYIGSHLPYVLWSKTNTTNGSDCPAAFLTCMAPLDLKEQSTLAIGTKFALSPSVSVKSQVDWVHHFNNTNGFVSAPRPAAPPYPLTAVQPDFYVFTLGLTAVF